MGMVMPHSMKAIIGITTSLTFRSNSTPSVVQWRTTTSWGMWYFSLNNSIRAGVLTKRSNLPIVSLWNVEWLAEEVSRGNSRSSECETYVRLSTNWSSCLWRIVKLSFVKVWWMPGYKRSEVANFDKKWKKITSEGFYSWDERRKRRNPAQILKMRSEPLDLYSIIGCLERNVVLSV